MFCSAREAFAIYTFATDRRDQAKNRKALLRKMEQHPHVVDCWLQSYPKHELREVALFYRNRAAQGG